MPESLQGSNPISREWDRQQGYVRAQLGASQRIYRESGPRKLTSSVSETGAWVASACAAVLCTCHPPNPDCTFPSPLKHLTGCGSSSWAHRCQCRHSWRRTPFTPATFAWGSHVHSATLWLGVKGAPGSRGSRPAFSHPRHDRAPRRLAPRTRTSAGAARCASQCLLAPSARGRSSYGATSLRSACVTS